MLILILQQCVHFCKPDTLTNMCILYYNYLKKSRLIFHLFDTYDKNIRQKSTDKNVQFLAKPRREAPFSRLASNTFRGTILLNSNQDRLMSLRKSAEAKFEVIQELQDKGLSASTAILSPRFTTRRLLSIPL